MMSLLTKPRHEVIVQPYTTVRGSIGQGELVPDGNPIKVRCNVHLLGSSEVIDSGTRVSVDGSITATSWPWDENTRITFCGEEFDQAAAAVPKTMGRRTRHFQIRIRRRTKKVSS